MKLINISVALLFLVTSWVYGQDTPSERDQLLARRNSIKNELNNLNVLLKKNKSNVRNLVYQLGDTNLKIEKLEELISLYSNQIEIINQQIVSTENQIIEADQKLDILMQDYANIITSAYKSRANSNRLLMLLFSNNLFQAYKRNQYLKQYKSYRETKKQNIDETIINLKSHADSLEVLRDVRLSMITDQESQKGFLLTERNDKKDLLDGFKQRESYFLKEIEEKEKLNVELEKEINRLVRATDFTNTPETEFLSEEFNENKGQLPWPIGKGVIIRKFGRQNHPIVPTTIIENNSITVATEPNAEVRSVFGGEVISVISFKGSNKSVLIKHGEYITVYKNLIDLVVEKGDFVGALQKIGTAFTNAQTGRTVIQFSLFENTEPQNPSQWLRKM